MNKVIDKYLRQVASWLPCGRRVKKAILTEIREIITAQLGDTSKLELQVLHSRFGTPQQIASAHVDEMETPELLRQLRIRRRIVSIILVAAVLFLAIWFGVAFIALIDALKDNDGRLVVEVYNHFYGGLR